MFVHTLYSRRECKLRIISTVNSLLVVCVASCELNKMFLLVMLSIFVRTQSISRQERAFFVGRALKVVPAGGYFRQNEQVTLSCISTDEHHQPVPVIWFKNNLIIASNGSNVIIDNYRSLTIIKFHQDDEGFYHCETHQEKFLYSPVVPVIYSIPLYFVQHPVNVTIQRGSVASFYCFADGSPKPSITWLKDSKPLLSGQNFGKIQVLEDGTLEIGNVQLQDEGMYTCVARNSMNESRESHASLTVMYAPSILNISSNISVVIDAPLSVECKVKGYPGPTISWIVKGDIDRGFVQTVTEDGVHRLYIPKVSDHHQGKVVCEAKNKLGIAKKELFLDVQRRKCNVKTEFTCDYSGKRTICIPNVWVCDMDNDCSDGSDELNCVDLQQCSSLYDFPCSNGRCIPWSLTCDGDNDCGDNTDEHKDSCFHKCKTSIFFTCRNWKCIPKIWRCDQHDDCGDSSDEMGCDKIKKSCATSEFQCVKSKKCVKKSWVCDKEKDCSDGSDENNCEYAACGADSLKFPCSNGECIPLPWKCDGEYDCTDRSDENECKEKPSIDGEVMISKCSKNDHQCDGVWCIHSSWLCDGERDCRDGSDERNCGNSLVSRSRCQQDEHECDEKCIAGNKICDGTTDCLDLSDEKFCKEYILYSSQTSINKLDLQSYVSTVLISELSNVVAIDIDIEQNMVYWTDINQDKIQRASIGTHNHSLENVIQYNLESPEGIAVDWIGKKLYWTDRIPGKIEVSELNGRNRAILISENVHRPRAIVVHPKDRTLFWTEWGKVAQIERCGMNGDAKTRVVLVKDNIYWPNGIALDYQTERLWWVDAKIAKIESVNLDGTNRRTELDGNDRDLGHPFSLDVFGEGIFWSEWRQNFLYRSTKKDLDKIVIMKRLKNMIPMDIKVVHPHQQIKELNPCGLNNGQCSHLCLLSPNKKQQYSCFCPSGMRLWKDNKTCTIEDSPPYILFANGAGIFYSDINLQHISPVLAGLAGGVAAIDIDVKNQYLYWSNVVNDTIERVSLSHIGAVETVIKDYLDLVDGIAFDWMNRKLYWTDGRRKVIEVADPEVKNSRLTLIDQNLSKPRAIVLHPKSRYMYWSDWGSSPQIERCGMNGDLKTREVVVKGMFGYPNGLAIDYRENKLWWADAMLDKIETSNLDGSLRRTVLVEESIHPFGLVVYNNSVLWTDWVGNKIYKADKLLGKIYFSKDVGSYTPTGIRVVYKNMQPKESNPCGRKKKGCSHLCLLNPQLPYYSCRCPNGMFMHSDNKTCHSFG